MQKLREIVYVNGGEIYKSPTSLEMASSYFADPAGDKIFRAKKVDGKRYFGTSKFKAFFDGGDGVDLSWADLSPSVTLWLGIGAVDEAERKNFDLYFAVDSTVQLQSVADYYGLPYPVDASVGEVIDAHPENICQFNAGGRPIVTGSVKFVDGTPSILKLYTYPKAYGAWDVWMYGASYFDGGKCWEKGAVYQKQTGGEILEGANMREHNSYMKAEVIYTERVDGRRTSYKYERLADPVLMWRGEELDASGGILDTKRYESSYAVRLMVCRMTNGTKLNGKDLCPDVDFWIGRSWFENRDEEELLFAVTGGSSQLAAVAAYYGMPYPISAEMSGVLDTNPEFYRARHYDVYGRGPGNWFPVIVGSVVLSQGKPIRLLMYTFMRQWETTEDLQAAHELPII